MLELLEKWAKIDSSKNCQEMFCVLQKDFSTLNGKDLSQEHLIHIKIRSEAPLKIILAGHMDTVLSPEVCPVRREGSRLRGSGVADMKGGLVVMLMALLCFEKTPFCDRLGFDILINDDEEKGSPQTTHLLQAKANKAHLALLFEPAFGDGFLVSARKGSANYNIASKGKMAHIGREPEKGKNAISPLARFIANLKHPCIHVSMIEGGRATNVVPDHASCKINVRAFSKEEMLEAHDLIEKMASLEELEVQNLSWRDPKPFDHKTEKLFLALRDCHQDKLDWRPSGGVCDGNTFAALGIPTIDTLGVVGGNLHSTEEYMEIKSLEERSTLVTTFLTKIAKKEIIL